MSPSRPRLSKTLPRIASAAVASVTVVAVATTSAPAAGAATAAGTRQDAGQIIVASTAGQGAAAGRPRPDRRKHPMAGVAYHALWGERTNADRRDVFDKLRHMGARWVRIALPWALVQPYEPTPSNPGWKKWGLDRVDAVVRMAHSRGLRITFTMVGTPGWANRNKGPRVLPDDPGDYARAIRWLAHRYRGRVDSWEIWNEASGGVYLEDATMAEYVALLCRAYPAVHRGSPKAKVLSAGTGGVDWRWIRQLYRAGAKNCFDVLAVHPYNRDVSPAYAPGDEPPLWMRNMFRARAVMRNHHDTAKPVWYTEFGWNTGSAAVDGVSETTQGKYLVKMFKMSDRRLPYVTRMAVYMAKDEDPTGKTRHDYGLYTYDMRPKASVAILRNYLAGRR